MITQDRLTVGAQLAWLRFPELRERIKDLLCRDANFRDMCEELADLDCAISAVGDDTGTRCREVLDDWISARDRLTREMADALFRANVIPIDQGHRARRLKG